MRWQGLLVDVDDFRVTVTQGNATKIYLVNISSTMATFASIKSRGFVEWNGRFVQYGEKRANI